MSKVDFSNTLADQDGMPKGLTGCERYGMAWGCDTGCPVLINGDCELKDDVNKELYADALIENGESI